MRGAAWWVLLVLVLGCQSIKVAPPLPKGCGSDGGLVGTALPPFDLPMLDEGWLQHTTFEGDVQLVNVWATWCKPCRDELPALSRLAASHPYAHFVALAAEPNAQAVAAFVQQHDVHAAVAFNAEHCLNDLGARSLPVTLVVDTMGRITASYFGYHPECFPHLEQAMQAARAPNGLGSK